MLSSVLWPHVDFFPEGLVLELKAFALGAIVPEGRLAPLVSFLVDGLNESRVPFATGAIVVYSVGVGPARI